MLKMRLNILIPAIATLAMAAAAAADTVRWTESSTSASAKSIEVRSLFDNADSVLPVAGHRKFEFRSVTHVRLRLWDLKLREFEVLDTDDGVDLSLISSSPLTNSDNLVDAMRAGRPASLLGESHFEFVEILTMSGRALSNTD